MLRKNIELLNTNINLYKKENRVFCSGISCPKINENTEKCLLGMRRKKAVRNVDQKFINVSTPEGLGSIFQIMRFINNYAD